MNRAGQDRGTGPRNTAPAGQENTSLPGFFMTFFDL